MSIIMSLGEEIGWRGYLLKNLKSKISNFYIRAIIVGIIWSVWHIPTYVVAGSALWKDGLHSRLFVLIPFIFVQCL
uniref:CPBP family intramembrane glutamic endopeptidase n=1 Tax=Wolbachia endosymbiont (group A) of Andrena haemorrhoa TaxID=2953976 RepID=UPI0038737CAB